MWPGRSCTAERLADHTSDWSCQLTELSTLKFTREDVDLVILDEPPSDGSAGLARANWQAGISI